jgi:hypothetical protein
MANTPRTKSQIAGVLHFFGPHQEKTDPTPTTPSQIHGFFSQPKPTTVPTNPATATGNKGRRIGQFVFMLSDDLEAYTDLTENAAVSLG